MQERKRTDIATLGEFGLIDRLTEGIELKNNSSIYGVGDDAAVLSYPDKQVLVTTDLLMEGVHFDLTYVPLKHLGYKAAIVNMSDIYAMNGTPKQIIISVALSKRFCIEDMEELYAGIRLAWAEYRRTKYPQLTFPSTGKLSGYETPPTRLIYPSGEKSNNASNYASVQSKDTRTTKIFWDVK